MRLTRRARRTTVFVHVLAAVSWLGVDLAMGVLSYTGLTTDDPRTMATAYTAIGMFAVPLLLTLGLLTLLSGVLLGLGTRHGLVRHWWVLVKLALNLVLTSLVLLALQPVLQDAVREARVVDATLGARIAAARFDLAFPPLVSGLALLFAAWLGWFKPWGRTPFRLTTPDRGPRTRPVGPAPGRPRRPASPHRTH